MAGLAEVSLKAPRMLIADDDPAVVRLLADRCAKTGFEIETATNGIQALIKAIRNQPDVLIIDINMPEADGLSVCTQLLNPAKNSFNVVVVTGSRDPEIIERCERLGLFYARKGPDFWSNLASALTEIFPTMAGRIKHLETQSTGARLRRRPCVLLIDDDPNIEKFLAGKLGQCGVDMLYAPDAMQGYRIACREEPSAIISDYFMPKGDAFYLLGRLRTTAVTENIPVFVLSGRPLDNAIVQNLKREINGRPGALQIFKKSFDIQELFESLQKFCGFEKNQVEA